MMAPSAVGCNALVVVQPPGRVPNSGRRVIATVIIGTLLDAANCCRQVTQQIGDGILGADLALTELTV
jgi:hypothetical protein